jgi:hypothetical protein
LWLSVKSYDKFRQMTRHFGEVTLAEVAKTFLQKVEKEGGNTLAKKLQNRKNFSQELSSLFGQFFLPLKTFKQDIDTELENCVQSILQGKNVLDKLAEIDAREIDSREIGFMRTKYLDIAAHAGQMLLSLYYIESYEQNASAFSCQQEDIDSYFDNVKNYVEHAEQFDIRQNTEKSEMRSQLKNYFVIIDPKDTFERNDVAFKSWLQTFNFTFNLRGVYDVYFEQIDTKDAKMIVASEKVENKLIYHNKLFHFPITSSKNTSRPATKEELFFFKTVAYFANTEGHLLIVDPADDKLIWTIRNDHQYISAIFDQNGKLEWQDSRPIIRSGLFSDQTN